MSKKMQQRLIELEATILYLHETIDRLQIQIKWMEKHFGTDYPRTHEDPDKVSQRTGRGNGGAKKQHNKRGR